MLDAALRRLIAAPLERAGRFLADRGVAADAMTIIGFAVGMLAVPALACQHYGLALAAILVNRLADGLDGAIARQAGQRGGQTAGSTDLGGYLDIVLDFLFYAAVPLGFALADPAANALAACVLLASFIGTGASFLAYAVLAAKRGLQTERRGRKSFYHMGGLAEGTETILAFTAFCLLPAWFPALAYGFAALCALTILGRIALAWREFGGER
ncbi:CDP-alcohol phosphatidyltransferase family protein [Oceanibaculum pacificum]|uniref:CDP-alcohol phosphatidyltransferase n=1 Tax=Oceanibaculum pacificum TaxID=580166 RepID=A0A154VUK0_9PROT|nr:CDP-alcohol phosphatidyltransferase family protein [Oceanibaculum pacificum]KZD04869.1 CDP-alcohol phosphatidyltransferase [Oceanibaculum pacificum]